MDKIKVNNQVVKMRKHVKRAKLFAINKFTKQLKQLQNKKGNGSQAEKNQRKVERLLEKIKILKDQDSTSVKIFYLAKKMLPDFVSKKALSKAQNWNTLLTQKNIPLEDQCLALLANDSEIQKEVEKFHAKECHLVEKIPTLLLEWEMKSQMPKSPDKKKKASDIKRQKLDKIAKRKKSNFKGATFPNNVTIDKSLNSPNLKKRKFSQNSNVEDNDANEKKTNENPELMEYGTNDKDQLNSESTNNGSEEGIEEFFTKAAESKEGLVSKKQTINNNTCHKSVKTSDSKGMCSENSNGVESDVDEENEDENADLMEDDLVGDDHFNSESSSDGGSEEFFEKASKSKKHFASEKALSKNCARNAKSTKDSSSNVKSSDKEESRVSCKDNIKDSISSKVESAEGSATSTQPSIFERLAALANRDARKLKPKNKSNAQNTKAIKVLDLNELQDSELIPIQSSPTHSEELHTPQTVVPKKDSFFLNGDEEVESSDDDELNNYRHSQTKRKFSDFDESARGGKFKRNNFTDKPRKSFNSFKDKDFSGNENRFQNKNRNDFSRSENRFQNKGKDFNRNENRSQNKKEEYFNCKEKRFQKNMKGDFQLKNIKTFDNKSRRNPQDDSFNQGRENKNSTMSNSFQKKKQSIEKGEKNITLHPSWEAKNKLKEAAKSGFKGKRIVFD